MRGSEFAIHVEDASARQTKATSFSELTDTATDAQTPEDITVRHAARAGKADTLDTLDSTEIMVSGDELWSPGRAFGIPLSKEEQLLKPERREAC